MTISTVDSGPRQVTRSAHVPMAPQELFELVADPHRHRELDGSGTVKDTVSGPARLSDGAKFSVGMKQYGVPYRITSRVTAFEDGRLIEWRHPMGHRWRWEFAPGADGGTDVIETFDYSGVIGIQAKLLEVSRTPSKNAKGITETLRQLQSRRP